MGDRELSNRDAERGVLLGMAHYQEVRSGAALALDQILFTDEKLGQIFNVLAELRDKERIDRVLLEDTAKRLGVTEDLSFLLSDSPPERQVLRDYYALIKEHGTRAALIRLSNDISLRANSTGSLEDTLKAISLSLGTIQIAHSPLSQEVSPLRETVKEVMENLERYAYGTKDFPGIKTGLRGIDDYLFGLNPGLIVFGARPYLPLQELAINIALNTSEEHHVLYATGNITKELFTQKALEMLADFHRGELSNCLTPEFFQSRMKSLILPASTLTKKINLLLSDNIRSAYQLSKQCAYLKAKTGLDLLIVDTFQDLLPEIRDSREAQVFAEQAARELKNLSTTYDLPILVLSELSSEVDRRVKSTRPKIGHLRDYGALEYRANQIVLLHSTRFDNERDQIDDDKINLLIDRNDRGPLTEVSLTYHDKGKFSDRLRGVDIF